MLRYIYLYLFERLQGWSPYHAQKRARRAVARARA